MEDGKITSNHRLISTIPTIRYCIDNGAKSVIILSHMGKPGRQVSLQPVAKELQMLLQRPVTFLESCIGEQTERVCSEANKGSVILLENIRFHLEEIGKGQDHNGNEVLAKKEDVEIFRNKLSKLGDVFVNDAFGVVQRSHSSMAGINIAVRAAGLLMEKEITYLSHLVQSPERPFFVILGGAKVADKIKLIENLIDKIDELIIGGAMAFTFLKVMYNTSIGNSLFDKEGERFVDRIVRKAEKHGVKIHLPLDIVTAKSIEDTEGLEVVSSIDGIAPDRMGLDCGPKTVQEYTKILQTAKTIFWNGPMGVFERHQFSNGTRELLNAVAELTNKGVRTVLGGGDTASACLKFGRIGDINHVSTGGGACIAFLEGRELPGISHLCNIED